MADTPAVGSFCWNELVTKDAGAAKAFYAALFGWKLNDMPMGPGTYTMIENAGVQAGGLMQIRPDMGPIPSHWMSYVLVASVDAAIARASELGARTLVPGMDIPGIGRFGVFEDPTGASLAVFQSMKAAPAAKPAKKPKAKAKSKPKAKKK